MTNEDYKPDPLEVSAELGRIALCTERAGDAAERLAVLKLSREIDKATIAVLKLELRQEYAESAKYRSLWIEASAAPLYSEAEVEAALREWKIACGCLVVGVVFLMAVIWGMR